VHGLMRLKVPNEPMTDATIAASELDKHRPYLLKFAMLQLRQREVAEDLVQEAFLAALKSGDSFAGRSSVRTWLTSILLNKIVDHRRRAGREISIDAQQELDGADSVEALFQANGRHIDMPREWRNPEETLTDRRFFAVLEACVERLSETAGRVFLLREMMGFSIDEICKELGVSATNCSVLLHRARMRLRTCLEDRWFAAGDKR
jgi:RNA polymerase sigma-70 factor, ECF subfamily